MGEAEVVPGGKTPVGTRGEDDNAQPASRRGPPGDGLDRAVGRSVVHHDDRSRCGSGAREGFEAGERIPATVPVHHHHADGERVGRHYRTPASFARTAVLRFITFPPSW